MPLLLDEWRLLHPASEETVRTFLVKIKHLKSQKEIIKKYLGVSGLLPMGANGENNVPETADTNTAGPVQNGEKTDTIGVIKTESEVIFDLIFDKGQLIDKNFVGFLVDLKTPKEHYEIN